MPASWRTRQPLIQRVAFTASHEIYPSAEAASREAVARSVAARVALAEEARRPRSCARQRGGATTPILRSIDAQLDDLKFLYPVLDNSPAHGRGCRGA